MQHYINMRHEKQKQNNLASVCFGPALALRPVGAFYIKLPQH